MYSVTQANIDCLRITLERASLIQIGQHLNTDLQNLYSYANRFHFFFTQILIFLHGHKKILVQFDNFKIVNKSSTTLTLRRFYFTLLVHSSLKTTFLTA